MMIVSCDNSKREGILDYIGEEYYKCLYLYSNLIRFGCQSEYTRVWELMGDSGVSLVMLSYHSALHLFSKEMVFDIDELESFIVSINPSIICASSDIVKLLEPRMKKHGFLSEYGHIGRFVHSTDIIPNYEISLADLNDVDEIATLLYNDEDIGASYSYVDLVNQMRERLGEGYVRSFVVKEDNKIVAHLGTGAETERMCTISYVITEFNHRGRGLCSALISYACERLKEEGKEIYSVYYPENSHRLHLKNGFEDCCEYGKLFRNIH